MDPLKRIKEGRQEHPDLPCSLASDETRAAIQTLKLTHNTLAKQISTPANILVDKDGVVRSVHYSTDMTDRMLPKDVLALVNQL